MNKKRSLSMNDEGIDTHLIDVLRIEEKQDQENLDNKLLNIQMCLGLVILISAFTITGLYIIY